MIAGDSPLAKLDRRAHLLAVPDFGKIRRIRGKLALDFSPDIRGTGRFLYTLAGKAFESEDVAEATLRRIREDARTIPLVDAVARYRGKRSRSGMANAIVDAYLDAAPKLQSPRTGRFLSPRTVAAYRGVLGRARPFLEGKTIREATTPRTLREFKAWFRLPAPEGRGLSSDQEARNAFAAFRAVVAWYRLERTDFPAPEWPSMPTAIRAKRENESDRVRNRITLAEVVRGIEAIPEPRRGLFWTLFYTQARPAEVRGILGRDWNRPTLEIRRSASNRSSTAEILPRTKTGARATYDLPEWVADLIDRHSEHVRFNPDEPLFRTREREAPGPLYSDDAIRDAWISASERAGIPWVPIYRAMKHVQIGALRDAGVEIEDIVSQARWTSSAMLEHYDERAEERRGGVVAKLDELVGQARRK